MEAQNWTGWCGSAVKFYREMLVSLSAWLPEAVRSDTLEFAVETSSRWAEITDAYHRARFGAASLSERGFVDQ